MAHNVMSPPAAVPVDIFMRTHGARIMDNEEEAHHTTRDGYDIYLPNHIERVSHIAVDVGGSLAKVVYFTYPSSSSPRSEGSQESEVSQQGTLKPAKLGRETSVMQFNPSSLRRRSLPAQFPGGRLNFTKFESGNMDMCMAFLRELIERSALANDVTMEEMQKSVRIMATGGGAHLFYDRFKEELGVEVQREDEMACLITGLNFMTLIPEEVFWFSDELVDDIGGLGKQQGKQQGSSSFRRGDSSILPNKDDACLPRPSASPPLYEPMFETEPSPKLPCLLVNIGSGVSILKIDEFGKFERVSGTSLGGGTLWGLLGLLTDAQNFDEMLDLCERGDNSNVDMLVGDIYGPVGLDHLGLSASTIASSFGKVFRWDRRSSSPENADEDRTPSERRRARFRQEDICRSLLYAISNNIGQIAHMNAEKYQLDRVYFGGCFIRGHQATIATLSYAIRFWSKGRRRAYFLRHEGYLGAIGAWVRHIASDAPVDGQSGSTPQVQALLAEALAGAQPHEPTTPKAAESSDSSTQAVKTLEPSSNARADSLSDLLNELSILEKQDVPADAASLEKLMSQLDRAHQVADAIESRVDHLLTKIQALLPRDDGDDEASSA